MFEALLLFDKEEFTRDESSLIQALWLPQEGNHFIVQGQSSGIHKQRHSLY